MTFDSFTEAQNSVTPRDESFESFALASSVTLTAMDEKIKALFPNESVYKNPAFYNVFNGRNLPSFMKDWMIKCFTEGEYFDRDGCLLFLDEKIPPKGTNLRQQLLRNSSPLQILSRLIIQTDLMNGKMEFSIPDLGIGYKEGIVSLNMAQARINSLHEGEVWGILTLNYIPPYRNNKGYVELTDFKPFVPYTVDVNYYYEARRSFSTLEWIDLLIRSMEYNPDYHDPARGKSFTLSQKLMFISRLLVYVEPNLNMIELAPKGTGKSYVFTNLSKYGWAVSGGIVTRAGLFYNIATKTPGTIHNYDFLALDEVETLQFAREEEILGAFKNYLENGRIVVGNYKGLSDCGLMLLGNITLDKRLRPKNRDYFLNLPSFFHSSALIDRIHGFIEGWELYRFNEDLKVKGMALNTEYFSEILHLLRTQTHFAEIIDQCLSIPLSADTRDTKAVKKMCCAYLKLLYPHAQNPQDIPPQEFIDYILQPALQKRAIIRQQLSEIDQEYSAQMPDIRYAL